MDRIPKDKFKNLDPESKAMQYEWVLVGDYYYPKHSLTVARSRMMGGFVVRLIFILTPLVAGLVAWLLS